MSDLVVLGLKLLFLALLWLFVFFAVNVVRSDLFGRRPSAGGTTAATPVADHVPVPVAHVAQAAPVAPKAPKAGVLGRRKADRHLPTHLRVTAGTQIGLRIPLGERLLIGRTTDAQLVLDDTYMSTRHALITRGPTGYVVEDLGSTNGTFLNDRRLTVPSPITAADTLRIGRTTMTLEV